MINTTGLTHPALDKITRITPNRRGWRSGVLCPLASADQPVMHARAATNYDPGTVSAPVFARRGRRALKDQATRDHGSRPLGLSDWHQATAAHMSSGRPGLAAATVAVAATRPYPACVP